MGRRSTNHLLICSRGQHRHVRPSKNKQTSSESTFEAQKTQNCVPIHIHVGKRHIPSLHKVHELMQRWVRLPRFFEVRSAVLAHLRAELAVELINKIERHEVQVS